MMPINIDSIIHSAISYQSDLCTTFFDAIEQQPWAMLLHSGAKDHCNNRFDILVADPIATLTHKEGTNLICFRDGATTQSTDDPFFALAHLQEKLLPAMKPHPIYPFLGGALGYFSYDLGRQIEPIDSVAINDLEMPQMAVGIYNWALIVDHKEKTAVIIQPENENRLQWLNAQKMQLADKRKAQTNKTDFALTSAWQANMSFDDYQTKFNSVRDYLYSGDCYQINLAQRFCASFKGCEWQAYKKLAEHNAAPFCAFIRLENCAVLSISPERFLKLEQGKIETKPIKGTRARSTCAKQDAQFRQDLQTAEKDRAENLMIVDLLRNDIGRVAKAGSVKVPSLFAIESFPAVHHLVSTITAQLAPNKTAIDLLQACFPGGSITGAPKIRAMQIIEELEPHRRNIYCGSIGYISRCGTMDTNIAIRTLVCIDSQIYAWAGGGLVVDSQVDSEYQETLDKLCKILPILE